MKPSLASVARAVWASQGMFTWAGSTLLFELNQSRLERIEYI